MSRHPAATLPSPARRRLAMAGALLVCGCGTAAPPARLYRLPVEAPDTANAPAAETGTGSASTWELAAVVTIPEYLDREALVVSGGATRLEAWPGDRWAEPLRDSVPRLLRHDLALLRGAAHVWPAPAPPGVTVDRRLRVELLALHADAQQQTLRLHARWWLTDPRAQAVPVQDTVALQLPLEAIDADGIVRAHRLALWRMAQHIARSSA